MKQNILMKCLLVGVLGSVGVLADMTVVKSAGELSITSTISGTVIAKIMGPNDEVMVDEKYEGNSFSWTISGADGAYRYDVRVVPSVQKVSSTNNAIQSQAEASSVAKSDYIGGSIEIRNDQMMTSNSKLGGKL